METQWITVKQAKEILPLSTTAFYQLLAVRPKSPLNHIRVGAGRGRILISAASLRAYVASAGASGDVVPERQLIFLRPEDVGPDLS